MNNENIGQKGRREQRISGRNRHKKKQIRMNYINNEESRKEVRKKENNKGKEGNR